ncbi:SDR family oxidoreductase [Capillimicrobium parvum]|uniref:Enoyl-[acyl-carrier-protein] reductase [NADPH] FabL n=1 Tax=Capillimicrobium parvum TaxID=2884022 RepID=A0A9E6XVW8_9ACTN|nr:SDR family oxidoreductase [Capillimicrobium parvum]UGS34747.1 Enoyl-[acyl-carrier-protein] reductase [NADPH] FabL [Capillimicrobium parvum]
MTICVTGGSSGLGRAIAERFAAEGGDVFINYHADDDAAQAAAAAVEAAGGRPHVVKADMGTTEGVETLIGAVRERTDRLDQLVHCAAMAVTGSLLETDPETLTRSITVNGLALVALVRAALPLMGPGSNVVYLTSRGARFAIPNYGTLGTAKALGEHIVRYLAVECAPHGIRVNSVSPGPVETAAFRAMFPGNYRDRLDAAAKANPSGRGIELEDAAELVWALTRPELAMVQGQTVTVDGGLSL